MARMNVCWRTLNEMSCIMKLKACIESKTRHTASE
jgi:hypothetical protein